MRAVVTGGAGFLGSHLCRRLLGDGWDVLCIDSMLTGDARNIADLEADHRFRFDRRDIVQPLSVDGPIDQIFHLASPASPIDYLEHPIETLTVGSIGTLNVLGLARDKGAGIFIASTSEVYGDPLEHPQKESYWGNVNPIGPRSVYDESKRFGEAATMAFHRSFDLPVKIVRIFNTYGPAMRRDDGRAVPTFIQQALAGEPLTVHGDGTQTRSLCYVDDLIEGFVRVLAAPDLTGPVNLGNPEEVTMLELARLISELSGASSDVVFRDRPIDDPEKRRPDISVALARTGWSPEIPLRKGLGATIEWAKHNWGGPAQRPSSPG